jgi:hypothetical protein
MRRMGGGGGRMVGILTDHRVPEWRKGADVSVHNGFLIMLLE